MMPEPPGSGVYLSARGRRTRSAIREYPPGRRPLTSEIGCGYCRRFRQVKGVENYADKSVYFARDVLEGARGTRMILSISSLRLWAHRFCRGGGLCSLLRPASRSLATYAR